MLLHNEESKADFIVDWLVGDPKFMEQLPPSIKAMALGMATSEHPPMSTFWLKDERRAIPANQKARDLGRLISLQGAGSLRHVTMSLVLTMVIEICWSIYSIK
jgi:hypothetical protein